MPTMYDQSKVPAQYIAKHVCIEGMRRAALHKDGYNEQWSDYGAHTGKQSDYEQDAAEKAAGLLPPEGLSRASQEGATIAIKPSEVAAREAVQDESESEDSDGYQEPSLQSGRVHSKE